MSRLESIILLSFIQFAIKLDHIAAVQIESLDTRYSNISYPTHISTRTIERVATFTNGCYKQRIIEPDLWNAARFFETEQLICPPNVNASAFTMLTQQLQRNNSANLTTQFKPASNTPADVVPATNFINYPHNVPYVPHVASTESKPVVFMPPPAVPSATHPVSTTVQNQQLFDPAVIKSNATPHAAILSKKTVFYDSANSLNNFNCFFVFMVTATFFYYNQNHFASVV